MDYISTQEAADELNTSGDTVIRLIKRGELEAEQLVPHGPYRIYRSSLEAYAHRRKIKLKSQVTKLA